ncbi:SlyX protein [Pusillimonas sp. TS35]|uniref:SlyX family protein n=1 Tax=Paracandidimonas lactea TaxID=2895524 RepID=UPI0013697CE6|nr:SlyX family protein [Paracandidimonas lactea]MYN11812.1 SlyX protein [Pusillimonas sp. TS35]
MDNTTSIEKRLTELEVKAAYADDLLDQLNQTIFRQQQQIEWLARELHVLREQVPDGPALPRNPRDELPPHY